MFAFSANGSWLQSLRSERKEVRAENEALKKRLEALKTAREQDYRAPDSRRGRPIALPLSARFAATMGPA